MRRRSGNNRTALFGRPETSGQEPLLQIPEDDEQRRHDKEQCQRAGQHAADRTHADRNVAVGADTLREHQRQHAENHRERGHQDRTQPGFGRRHGRRRDTHALLSAVGGVLRKQNGRFGEQADQHDQPRLHIDIVFKPPQLREDETAGQTERHGEDDGERDEEAFVKCAENQINEEDADDEDHRGGVARRSLLTRHAAELVAVSFGQGVLRHLPDRPNGLSRTVPFGRCAVDGDSRKEVES